MFSALLNRGLRFNTLQNNSIQEEVEEFRALKVEINKARCVIEFNAVGEITAINKNALTALDYIESELLNQHHRILISPEEASSVSYREFWVGLGNGITQSGSFKLKTKTGKTVWMQGYYAPVLNSNKNLRKVVVYLTDITQSNNNLHLLQAEDEALNASFGVVECNLDMKILECNDLFAQPLGYKQDELIGKPITDIVSPEVARSKEYQALWEALARGERKVTQIKRVSRSGNELWYQGTYAPIKTPEGKTFKVIIYSVDITEEKNRNANYEGQIQAIRKAQTVLEMDMNGIITDVNDVFCHTSGYQRSEIIGKNLTVLLNDKFRNSSEFREFGDRLKRGETVSGEFKLLGKGDKEFWISANYNPILDLNLKPFKVVKYGSEITQIKKERADNEGQLSSINRSIGKVEYGLDGLITKVNDIFCLQTGYSAGDLIGKHHDVLVTKTVITSSSYQDFWKKLNAGEFVSGIYETVGKDGKQVWLNASYNPILDENGIPYKVVHFAIDITQQKLTESNLASAVAETKDVIDSAKLGDLSSRVSLIGKDGEVAELCKGVNALLDNMAEMVSQVLEAVEAVNAAASEIAKGNNDLSSRTEEQASSLQQTTSSMSDLAITVKQNAGNAKEANELAAKASGVAEKGGEVVGEVVRTMSEINEYAHKIEDIISVIDGIAFQTNILALNAAVEAARAGEQGRGFAVVAGEVRSLAQRSSSAAKEIKDLINDSVNKVLEGTKLVENAGNTMEDIVNSVRHVTDIMRAISKASTDQSFGIDQVNSAISSMDEATQQNAALVEQAAAAAESLVEQASSLKNTVGSFTLPYDKVKSGSIVRNQILEDLNSKTTYMRRGFKSVVRVGMTY